MKFIAIKSDQHAVAEGTRVQSFAEGEEYEVSDVDYMILQNAGIAPFDRDEPEDEPKEAHPVKENKMVQPVANTKLKLK